MISARLLRAACALILLSVGALAGGLTHAQSISVFAAASLKNALDEAAAGWKPAMQTPGARVVIAYGASSALARQIENGAPAQIFISADIAWMDYLATRNLIRAQTRRNLTGNTLVLIAPLKSAARIEIRPGFALGALLGNGRLAIADPNFVPAGRYARAALERLGVWDAVSARTAPSENVRVALAHVARGEAPLGIVYGSDAVAEPAVRVLDRFDPTLHPAIVYPAALTRAANSTAAADFLAYLATPAIQTVLARHGFTPLR